MAAVENNLNLNLSERIYLSFCFCFCFCSGFFQMGPKYSARPPSFPVLHLSAVGRWPWPCVKR
jgi:hypothetical protein